MSIIIEIYDVLRDLVPFVRFKKLEKHPYRSVTFTKSNTPPWVFFTFFKLYRWHQITENVSNFNDNANTKSHKASPICNSQSAERVLIFL